MLLMHGAMGALTAEQQREHEDTLGPGREELTDVLERDALELLAATAVRKTVEETPNA